MYQILTDSGCDLPQQLLTAHSIQVVSFHYSVNGTLHTDRPGDRHSNDAVYEKLHAAENVSTTQINVGEYVEFFRPYVEAGTPIAYVGFSSGLSGSFSSAAQAKAILLEDHPTADIRVIDTLAASAGEGRLVLEAIRLRDAGASLDDLEAWLVANRLRLQQWFTVDSLDYLYHGGRVSRTAATLGTLLNIKPLLDVDPAGKLRMVGKVRARKKALSTLADKLLEALASDPTQPLLIATSGDWAAAATVRDHILAQAPEANIQVGPIGLTIASHTGFGCVAAFVMGDADRQ